MHNILLAFARICTGIDLKDAMADRVLYYITLHLRRDIYIYIAALFYIPLYIYIHTFSSYFYMHSLYTATAKNRVLALLILQVPILHSLIYREV